MSFKRHAIFDLDGTLVDSLPGIAWSVDAALASCGLPPAGSNLRSFIGPPIRSILATMSGVNECRALDRLEQAFRASYDSEGWRMSFEYPGAAGLLSTLRNRGIGLWIVTNKPAEAAERILRRLTLDAFFGEVICRDSRRPPYASKAEALLELVARRALAPAECVLIGDTAEDRAAAAAAAIECILVPHGYGSLAFCGEPDWTEVRDCFIRPAELAEVANA